MGSSRRRRILTAGVTLYLGLLLYYLWTPGSFLTNNKPQLVDSKLSPPHEQDPSPTLRDGAGSDVTETPYDRCHGAGPEKPRPGVPAADSWRAVYGRDVWVYSAFYDALSAQPAVRVVAISNGEMGGPLRHCQLWYSSDRHVTVSTLQEEIVPETHERRYSPFIYSCPLQGSRIPYAVSLTQRPCDHPQHVLHVHNNPPPATRRNFTVCVTPVNFNYSNADELVDTFEANRFFGADHLVLYNHSHAHSLTPYLEYYRRRGLLTVLPWDVPVGVDTYPPQRDVPVEIHYFAQLAALNDCLYRHMYTSRYLVFTDLDEVIVPRNLTGWGHVVTASDVTDVGSWVFACATFRKDWPRDEQTAARHPLARRHGMNTLLRTTRERYILPWGQRSKVILDPRQVWVTGVHQVWNSRGTGSPQMYEVPHEVALLHHYRAWEDSAVREEP